MKNTPLKKTYGTAALNEEVLPDIESVRESLRGALVENLIASGLKISDEQQTAMVDFVMGTLGVADIEIAVPKSEQPGHIAVPAIASGL